MKMHFSSLLISLFAAGPVSVAAYSEADNGHLSMSVDASGEVDVNTRIVRRSADGKGAEQPSLMEEGAQQATTATTTARPALERIRPLGAGRCGDINGAAFNNYHWFASEVNATDGSSPECERRCLQDTTCTGFATSGAKCGLITAPFYPSYAMNDVSGHCFWKQSFAKNTENLLSIMQRPVPKIIWSMWLVGTMPPLVEISVMSWKKLNPEYEIRLLDKKSVFNWISKAEIPAGYGAMTPEHQSDALRIILLTKYGGVWIDSSNILVKPLSNTFNGTPQMRYVMNYHDKTHPKAKDTRIDSRGYYENWFMAFPPADPLVTRVGQCTLQIGPLVKDQKATFKSTGMFSEMQIQFLNTSGVAYGGTYLSMHACFLKVISEDAAMWDWYFGPYTHHYDAGYAGLRLNTLIQEYHVPNDHEHEGGLLREHLMKKTDDYWFTELTAERTKVVKMVGVYRRFLDGYTKHDFLCNPGTLNKVFKSIGLSETEEWCEDALTRLQRLKTEKAKDKAWHEKINKTVVGGVVVVVLVVIAAAVYFNSSPRSMAPPAAEAAAH